MPAATYEGKACSKCGNPTRYVSGTSTCIRTCYAESQLANNARWAERRRTDPVERLKHAIRTSTWQTNRRLKETL